MRIYFITKEPDVCQLIADEFLDFNAEVKIFPSFSNLFETIFDKNLIPDILLFDFFYFYFEKNDFYEILMKQDKTFPIIFYNDPFPMHNRRKFFWHFALEKTGKFSDLSKVEPILDKLEKVLCNPNIAPYVSGIQKAKPYRSTNLRYIVPLKNEEINYYCQNYSNVITDFLIKENQIQKNIFAEKIQNDENSKEISNSKKIENELKKEFYLQQNQLQILEIINSFRLKHHLSHEIYSLFAHLYSKINVHVPSQELLQILNDKKDLQSDNSLRLAIFRLRKILKSDEELNLSLVSFDHGYMLKENS